MASRASRVFGGDAALGADAWPRHDAVDQQGARRGARGRADGACRHQSRHLRPHHAGRLRVSALIIASPTAFFILKSGGAAYLLWIAVMAIRKGNNFVLEAEARPERRRGSLKAAMANGFWVNLLNPKVIIFFMTFLPQFVTPDDPNVTGKLIFLGFTFIVVAILPTIAIVLAAHRLSGWLKAHKRVLRMIDYLFAGVFSLFAVKILLTQAR
ncbi:LysE family translocator [Martelella soudanensis]|uniref:LysE family translocator n=1 Tax=Martelella sp. NC18 TaxID=2740297 RepID=UPI0015DFA65B|nr:LysE family translocator [Martelella sp. NC18]